MHEYESITGGHPSRNVSTLFGWLNLRSSGTETCVLGITFVSSWAGLCVCVRARMCVCGVCVVYVCVCISVHKGAPTAPPTALSPLRPLPLTEPLGTETLRHEYNAASILVPVYLHPLLSCCLYPLSHIYLLSRRRKVLCTQTPPTHRW